jgi:hypothetical protein
MPVLSSLDIEFPVAFNAEAECWELTQSLPWENWQAISRRLE